MVTFTIKNNYLKITGINGEVSDVFISKALGNFIIERDTFSLFATDIIKRYNVGNYENINGYASNQEVIDFLTVFFSGSSITGEASVIIRDSDGNRTKVTADGNLAISDKTNGLSISKGEVSGTTYFHKFGSAPDFDQSDGLVSIWDGANDSGINEMQYNYSTSAIIDSISSSSLSDVQNIEIQGLDAGYNLKTQIVTLTGQTRKALSINLIRVFRLKNVGPVNCAGQIYCYENTPINSGVPIDTAKIRSIINGVNNQTLMSIFTVPSGKTAYLRSWHVSGARGASSFAIDVQLVARPFGQVFQLKHQSVLLTEGSSHIKHDYVEPEKFTEKTDIEMRASSTASASKVFAGFDIILVEN